MRTIGELLKEERQKKGLSIAKLEKETKIKKGFIEAVEKSNWDTLPDYPVILGFVKTIAERVGMDSAKATALLRRDYPPKTLSINPKPDVSKKFSWSPRLTFGVAIGLFCLFIFGYLAFQYTRFITPPSLVVDKPKEGEKVTESVVLVEGRTDTDSLLTVNNQPVILDNDGRFSIELSVTEETNEISVKALSRSGKETFVSRGIDVIFE